MIVFFYFNSPLTQLLNVLFKEKKKKSIHTTVRSINFYGFNLFTTKIMYVIIFQ